MIGTTEIVVIVVAALVLFGASAIPRLARSLGQAKKEFQKGVRQAAEESDKLEPEQPVPAKPGGSISAKPKTHGKSR